MTHKIHFIMEPHNNIGSDDFFALYKKLLLISGESVDCDEISLANGIFNKNDEIKIRIDSAMYYYADDIFNEIFTSKGKSLKVVRVDSQSYWPFIGRLQDIDIDEFITRRNLSIYVNTLFCRDMLYCLDSTLTCFKLFRYTKNIMWITDSLPHEKEKALQDIGINIVHLKYFHLYERKDGNQFTEIFLYHSLYDAVNKNSAVSQFISFI